MTEIRTEKQAIDALEKGAGLNEIPDEFRRLESVNLAAVKIDGSNLLYVETQTAEICVAAVQSAGEDVLKYVDSELRTVDLLKACGINTIEYEEEGIEAFEAENSAYWGDDNETASFYICGGGDAKCLAAAQKRLRRRMIDEEQDWEDVWSRNPMMAEEYELEFSPDQTSFKMALHYGNSQGGGAQPFLDIIENFVDGDSAAKSLILFLYYEMQTLESDSCGYYEFDAEGGGIEDEDHWSFHSSVYGNSREPAELRLAGIKKLLALRLIEKSGDESAIKQAKEALAEAEKLAEEAEADKSNNDDDDDGDSDDDDSDAEQYGYLANSALHREDYKAAIGYAKTAIKLNPKFDWCLNILACAYLGLKDYANALEAANRALELEPETDAYWDARAQIYEAAGEYQKALADSKKAVELYPGYQECKDRIIRCTEILKKDSAK